MGQVSWFGNGDDYYKDWKVSWFFCLPLIHLISNYVTIIEKNICGIKEGWFYVRGGLFLVMLVTDLRGEW